MNLPPVTVALYSRMARAEISSKLRNQPDVRLINAESLQDLLAATQVAEVLAIADPVKEEGRILSEALAAPESRVRWIQILSAGYDGLIKHGVPKNLLVSAQGGALAVPVAEHAVAMLLALTRQMSQTTARMHESEWNRVYSPPLTTLEGKTALIVGCGHVGREVSRRLRAFDMRLIAVTRSGDPCPDVESTVPLSDLHSVIGQCDVVIVTIALADSTRQLVNAGMLSACKAGALLVNVSRGEIVDQLALIEALKTQRLGGAALDVTVPEPLPPHAPLWTARNLLLSPHVAGAGSALAMSRIADTFSDNLARYRSGQEIRHQVRL